jgi:hypothetical protein
MVPNMGGAYPDRFGWVADIGNRWTACFKDLVFVSVCLVARLIFIDWAGFYLVKLKKPDFHRLQFMRLL